MDATTSVKPPPLGLIISTVDGKHVNVAWFQPIPVTSLDEDVSRIVVQRSEDGSQTSAVEFVFASQIRKHIMDAHVRPPYSTR